MDNKQREAYQELIDSYGADGHGEVRISNSQLADLRLELKASDEEIKHLRRCLVKIHSHRPHLYENETREAYNKRVLDEIREFARAVLTNEAYRE